MKKKIGRDRYPDFSLNGHFQWRGVYLEPPATQWDSLRRVGAQRIAALPRDFAEIVAAGREDLVRMSVQFEREIAQWARARGLHYAAIKEPRPAQSMVVSGHQPVIPHWGLVEKLIQLDAFGKGGVGAWNVIIDTDEAPSYDLDLPAASAENGGARLHRARYALTTSAPLYLGRMFLSSPALGTLGRTIREKIAGVREGGLLAPFERGWSFLTSLHDVPQTLAAPILLDQYLKERHFHLIPLSYLLRGAAFRRFVSLLTSDPETLLEGYNAALRTYRGAHGIKNQANPFPDLEIGQGWFELPLWALATRERSGAQERIPVVWNAEKRAPGIRWSEEIATIPDETVFAPRGAMVSLFLRLLGGDLFIHGRGGAHYDRATEQIAERWRGVFLPPFVVASADAILFEGEVARLDAARTLKEGVRRATTHPREALAGTWLPPTVRPELERLAIEREDLLEAHERGKREGESIGTIGRALGRVSQEIRLLLESALPSPSSTTSDAENEEVWRARDYPFFLFP